VKHGHLQAALILGLGVITILALLWSLDDGLFPVHARGSDGILYPIGRGCAGLEAGTNIRVIAPIAGERHPDDADYNASGDRDLSLSWLSVSPGERLLLAFYYPWYCVDYWSGTDLLDTPLFPYDSDDPVAIAHHVTWARTAGLDGFIVSWWGWENIFYDNNLSQVLDNMAGTSLQATIYFESLSRFFTSTGKVIDELKYVLDTHCGHSSYLRLDGRPVIFLYAVEYAPWREGTTTYEAWQAVVDGLHAYGYNPFFVADTLDLTYLNIFDGLHTYLALRDVSDYETISCQTHQAGKLWAANIYPGYDDRLLEGRTGLYIPRNDGQVYSDTFAAALQSDPDWIVVTSFNEWYENTHIEPGVLYGYDYLSQTAVLATQFDAWKSLPTVYVDAAYVGSGDEDGSAAHPYDTLDEALVAAVDGATLYIAGGDYPGPITLMRSVALEGGYEPVGWTRNLDANPTIIRGNGTGPVLRTDPGPCSPPLSIVMDGITITGGGATGTLTSGGGVYLEDASLTLTDCVIIDNRAHDYGGGVFVGKNGQLAIHSTYILSNTASVGGGLFADDETQLWLTNTVVARNEAAVAGGGLYVRSSASAFVINSTLTDNDARGSGKGLYAWSLSSRTVVITNSIVWGNRDSDLRCLENCSVGYSDVAGGWAGTGNLDIDPLFSNPDGGDYHLKPKSPAIDAGAPTGVRPIGPAPTWDIDQDPRPLGMGVDLGADEVESLGLSTVRVDKPVALLGEKLHYTLTLTSTHPSGSLPFWVTNTLPLLADYVHGSLHASTGTAVYLPGGSTVLPPSGGTLALPHILWTGTVRSYQPVTLSFAIAIGHQTALYCADVVNVALIQTDVGGPNGHLAIERSAASRISDGTLDHILVQSIADAGGDVVVSGTLEVGHGLSVHVAGYDGCGEYLGLVPVTWKTTGTLEVQESFGTSFTFTPTIAGGEGRIIAYDDQGHMGETGPITVVEVFPQISLSPSSLSSTQPMNQLVVRPFTISNESGTLTYKSPRIYTQPFEILYEWDESFFVDVHTTSEGNVWDYYFTPEQTDARLFGGEVSVTEIEVQSYGINLADWINWDWEVHLGGRDIGLPEGQIKASMISPGGGYERNAPCQLRFTVGERRNASSYVYTASHSFTTGVISAVPFYGHVKQSLSTPMQIADGLHAQVFFWTGDPRVKIQFDRVHLTVRGIVTYTTADWLTVDPVSGILDSGESRITDVGFDSRNRFFDIDSTVITILSSDPDNEVSIIPVTMSITGKTRVFLPLQMRNTSASYTLNLKE
jgi:hypothetical protein